MPEQIQGVQAWDRYSYANNNPVRYNDPSGHCVGPLLAACVAIGTFIIDHAVAITAIAAVGAATSFITADTPQLDLVNDPEASQEALGNNLLVAGLWLGIGTSTLEFGSYYSLPKPLIPAGNTSAELVSPSKLNSTNVTSNPPIQKQSAPDFVVSPNGTAVIVPKGATGPLPVNNGKGFQFVGGTGGNGLSNNASSVRIMDPTLPKPPSPGYPNGYVSYRNQTNQSINPYTGRTIARNDLWWHKPLRIE